MTPTVDPQEAVGKILYDPRLAPHCGGPAAALLFCWYEQIFRAAGYPPEGVPSPKIADWRVPIGYPGRYAGCWYRIFYRIGVQIVGQQNWLRNAAAGYSFWSPLQRDYLFFSLQVNNPYRDTVMHRNAPRVTALLEEIELPPSRKCVRISTPVANVQHIGREQAALIAARRVQGQLER